jgi:DNA-binding MarR family transcriptional regulator
VTAQGRRLLRQIHPAWTRAQRRARELLGDEALQGIVRSAAPLAKARREHGRRRVVAPRTHRGRSGP